MSDFGAGLDGDPTGSVNGAALQLREHPSGSMTTEGRPVGYGAAGFLLPQSSAAARSVLSSSSADDVKHQWQKDAHVDGTTVSPLSASPVSAPGDRPFPRAGFSMADSRPPAIDTLDHDGFSGGMDVTLHSGQPGGWDVSRPGNSNRFAEVRTPQLVCCRNVTKWLTA